MALGLKGKSTSPSPIHCQVRLLHLILIPTFSLILDRRVFVGSWGSNGSPVSFPFRFFFPQDPDGSVVFPSASLEMDCLASLTRRFTSFRWHSRPARQSLYENPHLACLLPLRIPPPLMMSGTSLLFELT